MLDEITKMSNIVRIETPRVFARIVSPGPIIGPRFFCQVSSNPEANRDAAT